MTGQKPRQTISCDLAHTMRSGHRWAATAYCSNDEKYNECPTFYGKTEGNAAGKVLEWLIDNGADVSRIEVCVH